MLQFRLISKAPNIKILKTINLLFDLYVCEM